MTGTDATADERGAEATTETDEPVHAGEPIGTQDRSERLNFAPGPRHPKACLREKRTSRSGRSRKFGSPRSKMTVEKLEKGCRKTVTVNRKMVAERKEVFDQRGRWVDYLPQVVSDWSNGGMLGYALSLTNFLCDRIGI